MLCVLLCERRGSGEGVVLDLGFSLGREGGVVLIECIVCVAWCCSVLVDERKEA